MNLFLRSLAVSLLLCLWVPMHLRADTPVISDAEAAQHIGQAATVEGTGKGRFNQWKREHVHQFRRCLSKPDLHRLGFRPAHRLHAILR